MSKKKVKKKKTKSESKELRCFIIMPFSKAEFEDSDGNNRILNQTKLRHIYKRMFSEAIKEYQKKNTKFVSITRYERTRGNFVKGIINDLDNADLVVADLTGLNPNVFYELGIRHTLKVGTIMLTQNINSLPADLRSYVAFEYKYHEESDAFDEYYPEFKKKLHIAIDEYIEDYPQGEYDNPVRDFIGSRNIFKNEQRIKEIKGNIKIMKMIMSEHIETVISLVKKMKEWVQGKSYQSISLRSNSIEFNNRLIMLDENIDVINFITDYITGIQILKFNTDVIRKLITKSKNIEDSRNEPFGFRNIDNKVYHILDLYEYYKKIDTVIESPIVKSFYKFINDWEQELESLTR